MFIISPISLYSVLRKKKRKRNSSVDRCKYDDRCNIRFKIDRTFLLDIHISFSSIGFYKNIKL